MLYTDHLAPLEAEVTARWRTMVPVMPTNCDLRRHLAERRTIAEVLAKRRSLIEASATRSAFANVVAFPHRDARNDTIEQRLAG
jgi:hypothetical protein